MLKEAEKRTLAFLKLPTVTVRLAFNLQPTLFIETATPAASIVGMGGWGEADCIAVTTFPWFDDHSRPKCARALSLSLPDLLK